MTAARARRQRPDIGSAPGVCRDSVTVGALPPGSRWWLRANHKEKSVALSPCTSAVSVLSSVDAIANAPPPSGSVCVGSCPCMRLTALLPRVAGRMVHIWARQPICEDALKACGTNPWRQRTWGLRTAQPEVQSKFWCYSATRSRGTNAVIVPLLSGVIPIAVRGTRFNVSVGVVPLSDKSSVRSWLALAPSREG